MRFQMGVEPIDTVAARVLGNSASASRLDPEGGVVSATYVGDR